MTAVLFVIVLLGYSLVYSGLTEMGEKGSVRLGTLDALLGPNLRSFKAVNAASGASALGSAPATAPATQAGGTPNPRGRA